MGFAGHEVFQVDGDFGALVCAWNGPENFGFLEGGSFLEAFGEGDDLEG